MVQKETGSAFEKYFSTHGTGWNPGEYAYILKEYLRREVYMEKKMKSVKEWLARDTVNLEGGIEYAVTAYLMQPSEMEPCINSTATCVTLD